MNRLAQLSLGLATFNGLASAFWRMPCERSGAAMMDPMVSPGKISDHNHVIHGGTNFGLSTVASDLLQSTSTSCEVTQDKSAYWTPSLHFMYPNGTTVMVEQVGGMLAYYLLYTNPGNDSITAFPEGFRMLAGNPYRRNFTCAVPEPPKSDWTGYEITQPALAQKALGFNCLDYSKAPEPSLGRHFLPDKEFLDANCVDGVRIELMFPSCWVGGDSPDALDPPDHQSHMAYPDLVMTGTCPDGYPVKTPSIFFETIWNTYEFQGQDGQFVLATGDPTGYSYHGDYMPAWENNMLQQAVDTCTNPSGMIQDCPLFDIQSQSDAASHLIDLPSQVANEDPQGPLMGLPGHVPIFAGPEPAPVFPGDATIAAVYPTDLPVTMPTIPPLASALPEVMGAEPINVVQNDAPASNTYNILPTGIPMPAALSSLASTVHFGNGPGSSTSFSTMVSSSTELAQITAAASMVNPAPTATDDSSAPAPVSTEIYTKGGIVYDVDIDENIVTKIVTARQAAEVTSLVGDVVAEAEAKETLVPLSVRQAAEVTSLVGNVLAEAEAKETILPLPDRRHLHNHQLRHGRRLRL